MSLVIDIAVVLKNKRLSNALRHVMFWVAVAQGKYLVLDIVHVSILRATRKTTTMLFKMLGIQRAWELSAVDMPKPRQIFVTKSRMLATKVKEYFTKLLESLAMAGYTLQEIAELKAQRVEDDLIDLDDAPESHVPARYSQFEDKHFPLFVTFDRVCQHVFHKPSQTSFYLASKDDRSRYLQHGRS
jgi:hypothetical protein